MVTAVQSILFNTTFFFFFLIYREIVTDHTQELDIINYQKNHQQLFQLNQMMN